MKISSYRIVEEIADKPKSTPENVSMKNPICTDETCGYVTCQFQCTNARCKESFRILHVIIFYSEHKQSIVRATT